MSNYNFGRGGDCYPRVSHVGQWIPEAGTPVDPCPIVEREKIITQDSLEWAEYDDLYQNGYPSCTLHGLGNAIMIFLSSRGRAKSDLDPHKAWIECTGGEGGYPIDAALVYGINKGFPTKDGSARVFVTEAFDCDTVLKVWSAVQRGDPVVFGHYAPRGHCECGLWIEIVGNDILLVTRGSYGKTYYNGSAYHRVPERDLAQGIPDFGAFAIREVQLRPVDVVGPDVKG